MREDTTYTDKVLFIGNLQHDKYETTRPGGHAAPDLEFLVHSKIPDAEIIPTRLGRGGGGEPGVNKTFGHVEFKQVKDALLALDRLHESEDHGRYLRAYPAVVRTASRR